MSEFSHDKRDFLEALDRSDNSLEYIAEAERVLDMFGRFVEGDPDFEVTIPGFEYPRVTQPEEERPKYEIVVYQVPPREGVI